MISRIAELSDGMTIGEVTVRLSTDDEERRGREEKKPTPVVRVSLNLSSSSTHLQKCVSSFWCYSFVYFIGAVWCYAVLVIVM